MSLFAFVNIKINIIVTVKDIYDKFQFFYFAKDDERTSEGEVIPGIGGMVYDRLGFKGQDDKNSYVPEMVKKRRSQLIAV